MRSAGTRGRATEREAQLTSPDVSVTPEVELLDVSSGRLEPVLGVLRGDSASNDVALGTRLLLDLLRLGLDPVEVCASDKGGVQFSGIRTRLEELREVRLTDFAAAVRIETV